VLDHPITDEATLRETIDRLKSAPRLALDTEFMRERTYFAELALVQLADQDAISLIDPLVDWPPALLGSIFTVAGQTKVLHAARQDIEVLLPLTETPIAPVLDTQVAAALLGFAPQIGYGDLVRQELGVVLEKTQQRTDWTKRPLSAAQLEYAADDVRWLLPLAEQLEKKLEALGRSHWLHEDMANLTDPSLYRVNPHDAWQRLKGSESLPVAEQQRLRQLAAWREDRAARRNLPRGWVMTDDVLRVIARAAPHNLNALNALNIMTEASAQKIADELFSTLALANDLPLTGIVQRMDVKPSAEERTRAQRLSECVRLTATELAMAPEVLATSRDLKRIARGDVVEQVLNGWRLDVLGASLRAI
jgi:ribonuclease D